MTLKNQRCITPPPERARAFMSCGRMVSLITRLNEERTRRGWNMRELARRSGCSLSSISRMEAGNEVSLSTALMVAKALGCRVEQLWTMDEVGSRRE